MCRRLPILTRFLASPAKMLGGFGLVWGTITNRYQSPDPGLGRWLEAFTNHYRREEGQGIDLSVVASVAGWVTVVGVIIA